MKAKIVAIGKRDAFYDIRHRYLGLIGEAEKIVSSTGGFIGANFEKPNGNWITFYRVKLHWLKESEE